MRASSDAKPWHHYLWDFRTALRNDDKEAFSASLKEALSGDNVIRGDGMLIDGNELGRSYNAMGQSDMGYYLIRAGRQWDMPEWVDGGMAAMNVMLTEYDEGGLRLYDEATGTAWYCGKTARHHDSMGGTLNKHLYATRTFLQAADELEALGRTREAKLYEEAGEAGFLKLVEGEQGPQLEDFFVETEEGGFFLSSWVYYSLGNADEERPYFLKDTGKNAHYHLYDMELIHQIGTRVDEAFDFRPFYEEDLGTLTPFGGMLQIYLNKLENGGLERDTPTPLGEFAALPKGNGDALDEEVVDWFESFLSGPGMVGTADDDAVRGTNLDETIKGHRGDDHLQGGDGADMIRGGRGKDRLDGGADADVLAGGSGRDIIIGGDGNDILAGNGGSDVFVFVCSPAAGKDRIKDFEAGDVIALDDTYFGAFGDDAVDPRAVTSAQIEAAVSSGHVAYDKASGELSVGGRVLAELTDGPSLGAENVILF